MTTPPFGLRMPPELHGRIKEAATANSRSMNAEIIHRLEASFDGSTLTPDTIKRALREVLAQTHACRCNPHTGVVGCPLHGPSGPHF